MENSEKEVSPLPTYRPTRSMITIAVIATAAASLLGLRGNRDFRVPAPVERNEYARHLAKLAQPGEGVSAFLVQFGGSPAEKLALAYMKLARDWRYEPDPPGDRDLTISAEDLLIPGELYGDCEDFAVLILAMLQELNIKGRIVMTGGNDSGAGHAFAQALIAGPGEDFARAENALTRIWRNVPPIEQDAEGTWLSLDGGPSPGQIVGLGPREFLIYRDGTAVHALP